MRCRCYIVGGTKIIKDYLKLLEIEEVKYIDEADLVYFTHGENINPILYFENITSNEKLNTEKDIQDLLAFKEAKRLGLKCIGTGRGSNLICALSGGKIMQDIKGHRGWHEITFDSKETGWVNSNHNKMMNPFVLKVEDYRLIATSKLTLEKGLNIPSEPEIIYFKKTDSLAIQFMPELMSANSLDQKIIKETITNFITDNL